jgi:DNA adenine methylase
MTNTTSKSKGPIIWYGGKAMLTKQILPFFTAHRTYVEPFGGGASLLFCKEPSPIEVYNDIDEGLVGFFRVLRDPELSKRLVRLCQLTPHSRSQFAEYRKSWRHHDEVEAAYRWFVVARQSYSGVFGTCWSSSKTESSRGMANATAAWLAAVEALPQFAARLLRVQVEHQDFRVVLKRYDTEQTLFYLDPPYVPETRRREAYAHELKASDHEELIRILLQVKGKCILSGYNSSIYAPLEAQGWTRKEIATSCFAVARTEHNNCSGEGSVLAAQKRIECLWISPE